jgi:hypothetical protein
MWASGSIQPRSSYYGKTLSKKDTLVKIFKYRRLAWGRSLEQPLSWRRGVKPLNSIKVEMLFKIAVER